MLGFIQSYSSQGEIFKRGWGLTREYSALSVVALKQKLAIRRLRQQATCATIINLRKQPGEREKGNPLQMRLQQLLSPPSVYETPKPTFLRAIHSESCPLNLCILMVP